MTAQALATDEIKALYRDLILDHARAPRHFGRLDGATHTARGINPLCGDKLALYLRVSDTGLIEESGFEGSGCAISVASASLLTEAVTGLRVEDAEALFRSLIGQLTDHDLRRDQTAGYEVPAKLRALEGVRDYPSRVKCATLAWHALKSALGGNARTATTE